MAENEMGKTDNDKKGGIQSWVSILSSLVKDQEQRIESLAKRMGPVLSEVDLKEYVSRDEKPSLKQDEPRNELESTFQTLYTEINRNTERITMLELCNII